MTADDRYQVVIRWIEQGALQEKSDLFTPATSIQMPPWLWGRADQPERRYQWSVRPVRLGTDGRGARWSAHSARPARPELSTGTSTSMSNKLASCLTLLADESRPVRTIDLADISDLSRAQVAEFHDAWRRSEPQPPAGADHRHGGAGRDKHPPHLSRGVARLPGRRRCSGTPAGHRGAVGG